MVALEYGKALFELAIENKCNEQIEENFNLFIEALKDNPDYMKVLTYPSILVKDKKNSLDEITKGFNKSFVNFLKVLIDNNRMNIINSIYEEYTKCLLQNKNILNVEVISPTELTQTQKRELQAQLAKFYQGKIIEITTIIDSNLIGGIKVIAQGEALDLSLQHKLSMLKAAI